MATNTISHAGIPQSRALTDADARTQECTEAIVAMATAAQQMLALDASALLKVAAILGQVKNVADSLMNGVNRLAEDQGANWQDESKLSQRLWEQHRALRNSSQANA